MSLNNDGMWGMTRVRRRKSNRSKSHLEKHCSLPELRLPPEECPQFHCRRCGFVNTLIPLCLWCTWSSQEAEHAFEVSIPRVRHVSSPHRAFQLELPPKSKYTHAHDRTQSSTPTTSLSLSAAHGKQPQISKPNSTRRKSRALFEYTPSFVAHSIPEAVAVPATTSCDRDMNSHDDGQMGTKEGDITGRPSSVSRWVDEDNVATATLSAHLYSASAVCEEQEVRRDPSLDPSHLLPSEDKLLPSVDRSLMSSTPSLAQNSPRLLFIDLHDIKTDDDQLSNLVMFNDNDIKPSTLSPRQHELRSLRRRKHLNVLQTSPSDLNAREPIPISLKLRSPPSKASLKLQPVSPTQDSTYNHDRFSQQISVRTDSTSNSPVTPETPMLQIPPSTSPTGLSTSDVSSSPVRLGHPSRPYYSAIRKQGISPTSPTSSSRPSSMIGSPPASLAPRRQSYTPSTTTSTTLPIMTTAASRHLSTSTMFCSPAYSLPSENGFSVFSLQDDDNVDEEAVADGDDEVPTLPPSPTPNTTRFSFPRRAKDAHRISLGNSIHGGGGSGSGSAHTQAQSLSYSRRSGYRGSGVGFSMSGQTELRMALAEDGFRFRETAPLAAAPSSLEQDDGHDIGGNGLGGCANARGGMDAGEKNSFMTRVRKLRKGLKDMLLMTSLTTS